MFRPIGVLVAASITAATFLVAPGAIAATGSQTTVAVTRAEASTLASRALAGLQLPTSRFAVASAAKSASKTPVGSISTTESVKAGKYRYDVKAKSIGSEVQTVTLYFGTQKERIAVKNAVRITVTRHGLKTPVLAVTTEFRRYLLIEENLVSGPLSASPKHFANRADLVSAVAAGLALNGAQVNAQYHAEMRRTQMSLDLSATAISAAVYLANNPKATDLTAVVPTHTTLGDGGYAGTVTVAGNQNAITLTATDSTDASSLTIAIDQKGITETYTIGGVTYPLTESA